MAEFTMVTLYNVCVQCSALGGGGVKALGDIMNAMEGYQDFCGNITSTLGAVQCIGGTRHHSFWGDIPQCTDDKPKNAFMITPKCTAQSPMHGTHVLQGDDL